MASSASGGGRRSPFETQFVTIGMKENMPVRNTPGLRGARDRHANSQGRIDAQEVKASCAYGSYRVSPAKPGDTSASLAMATRRASRFAASNPFGRAIRKQPSRSGGLFAFGVPESRFEP